MGASRFQKLRMRTRTAGLACRRIPRAGRWQAAGERAVEQSGCALRICRIAGQRGEDLEPRTYAGGDEKRGDRDSHGGKWRLVLLDSRSRNRSLWGRAARPKRETDGLRDTPGKKALNRNRVKFAERSEGLTG